MLTSPSRVLVVLLPAAAAAGVVEVIGLAPLFREASPLGVGECLALYAGFGALLAAGLGAARRRTGTSVWASTAVLVALLGWALGMEQVPLEVAGPGVVLVGGLTIAAGGAGAWAARRGGFVPTHAVASAP